MNDAWGLVVASAAGVVIGAAFYGGLFWTVQRGVASRRAALWFSCSLLLRMGSVLGGFYAASDGHWERLLACLLGFVAARVAVTRLVRPAGASRPPRALEGGRAS